MTHRTFQIQEQLADEIKAMDAALQEWTEKAARASAIGFALTAASSFLKECRTSVAMATKNAPK